MTAEPLLHPETRQQLARAATRPPHALALVGPAGIGKQYLATWLAAQLLGVDHAKLDNHPYFITVGDGTTAISIEAVRELEHRLSLKAGGNGDVRQVILMNHAETMTEEAQNALLKTLEEPPHGTMLLLMVNRAESLLPTVHSRLQTITVNRPAPDELLLALQTAGASKQDASRLLALSDGLPGLTMALHVNDQSHPLVSAVETARELLQAPLFGRLQRVDALTKDKAATTAMLYMLQHMAHAALMRSSATDRWQKVMRSAYDTEVLLQRNAQPKLALTNLMLNL